MSKMRTAGRQAALLLLDTADEQKKWTPALKAQWARAVNACNKLAGRKTRIRNGRPKSK